MGKKRSVVFGTLAAVCSVAALADLSIGRLAFNALRDRLSSHAVLGVFYSMVFVRNLVVLAAGVAFSAGLISLVLDSEFASRSRRVSLAFLSVVVLSTAFVLLVFPERWIFPFEQIRHVVLSAMVAAYAVVFHLGFSVHRGHRSYLQRGMVWLFTLSAIAALIGILSLWIQLPIRLQSVILLRATVMRVGEAFYLLGLIVGAFWLFPIRTMRYGRSGQVVAVIAALLLTLVFWTVRSELGRGFGEVIYAMLRLEWLLGNYPLVYTPAVSLVLGCALGAMVAKGGQVRGAIGLILVLGAGFAPATLDRMMMFMLAMTCFVLPWPVPEASMNAGASPHAGSNAAV